jgi:hypothetical protein
MKTLEKPKRENQKHIVKYIKDVENKQKLRKFIPNLKKKNREENHIVKNILFQ